MNFSNLRSIFKKYEKELFASFSLAFTLFFIAPSGVYQANASTLDFSFWNVFGFYIFLSLAAFILLMGTSLLTRRFFKKMPMVYTVILAYLWIQGNFLNYHVGKLSGKEVDWNQFNKFYIIEIFILVALAVLFIVFRRYFWKKINFILAGLLFLQSGPLLINAVINSKTQTQKHGQLIFDTSGEFKFSSNKNVVVIILDSFRRDIFEEILASNPEFESNLKDFTLFRDTASGFHQTYPSVPFILSGKQYDNLTTTKDYYDQAFGNSIPALLGQHGYSTEAYSMFKELYANAPDIWDNASILPWRTLVNDAKKQFLLAFIRYSPLILKPYFVNQYYLDRGSAMIDLVEFNQNSSNVSKSNQPPAFKLFHLRGVHAPFLLDENFSNEPESIWYSREGYVGQAKASLKAVDNLLNHMKAVGVYDNTMIFIMGDHGYPGFSSDISSSSSDFFYDRPLFIPNSLPYFGSPLLIVKNISQENDSISTSNVSVSLGDIAKTVAEELKIENHFPGVSIFSKEATKSRVRKFIYYNGPEHTWGDPFLPIMYEYQITGPVWEIQSWKFTGKTYANMEEKDISVPVYQYGSNIIDSVVQASGDLLNVGVSYDPTNKYAWAAAPLSCIYLPVNSVDRELNFSFIGNPFLKGDLLDQNMNVYMDEVLIASFSKASNPEVKIPSEKSAQITSDHRINLCMGFPDVKKSPRDYGMNTDTRLLGYRFTSIVIR